MIEDVKLPPPRCEWCKRFVKWPDEKTHLVTLWHYAMDGEPILDDPGFECNDCRALTAPSGKEGDHA